MAETPEDENTGNEDSAETPKTDDVEKAEDPADTLPEDLKTGDVDEEEPAEIPKTDDVENEEDPTETLPEDLENDDVEIEEPAEIVMLSLVTYNEEAVAAEADDNCKFDEDTGTLTLTGDYNDWDAINSNDILPSAKIKKIVLEDYTFKNDGSYEFGMIKSDNIEEISFKGQVDTSNVTSMNVWFNNCGSLIRLDLSKFNTAKVTDMCYMFSGCKKLEYVDLSSFVITEDTLTIDMFDECNVLRVIKAPVINDDKTVRLPGTFVDEDGNEYTVLNKDCAGKTLTRKGTGGGDNTGDNGNTGEGDGNNTENTGSDNTENTGSNSESSGNTSNTGSNSENSGNTSNAGSNSGYTVNNGNGSAAQNTGSGNGTGQTAATVLLPIQYTVGNGDTLGSIARKSGISLEWILAWNPQIQNPNRIYPGQVIILGYTEVSMNAAGTTVSGTVETPVSEEEAYYIVQKGDCLYRIAVNNGVSFKSVLSLNPELVKQKYIYAGQKVRLK